MLVCLNPFKTFEDQEDYDHLYGDKQIVQVVDLLLMVGDTVVFHEFVKKIRESHSRQIAQLLRRIEFHQ